MFRQFKKLLGHTFIYGTGRLAVQFAGFVLIPIYTRYLDPEQYGQLAIFTILISFLGIFVNMGFNSAFFKYYYNTEDEKARQSIINTSFFFLLILSTVMCITLFSSSSPISRLLFQTDEYRHFFSFVFAIVFLNSLSLIPLSLLRARERSLTYSFVNLAKFLVSISLIIYFVVFRHNGVLGVLQGMFFASLTISFYFIYYMIRNLSLSFSASVLKQLFIFGAPLMPTQLAVWIMTMADRFLLKHLATLQDVGIYTLGHKLGMVIQILIVTPFSIAWAPFMFAVSREENAKQFYSSLLTYFLLVAGFGALVLSVFAKEIIEIVAVPAYYASYRVVPLIAFSFVIYGAYFILTAGLNITKKTVYFPFIAAFAALCFVGSNLLLIPRLSIMGAATSTLISYTIMAFLTYLFSQQFYYIHYEYLRLLKIALVFVLLFAITSVLPGYSLPTTIALKVIAVLAFPCLLYLMGFFKKGELDKLRSIYRKVKDHRMPT